MAQATVEHQLIIRCQNLPDYTLAMQKLAIWNANGNQPPITINGFQGQLRINVTYSPYTIEYQ